MAFEGINNVIRCFLQREANATIKVSMLPKSFKTKHAGLGLNVKVWRIWLFLCCLTRQVIHSLVYYKPSGLSGAPERVQWPEHVYASFIIKSSLRYNNLLQKEVPNSVPCHLTGKKIKEERGSLGEAMGRQRLTQETSAWWLPDTGRERGKEFLLTTRNQSVLMTWFWNCELQNCEKHKLIYTLTCQAVVNPVLES